MLLALLLSANIAQAQARGPHNEARFLLIGAQGGDRHRERNNDDADQRNQGLDRAIRLVLRRTGGQYVSAEAIGDNTFRVVVRLGARIVAFRVNVRSDSVEEE